MFFYPPWLTDMEILIKKKKNWPFSTQAWWARVLFMIPESIKLGFHSVLAAYGLNSLKIGRPVQNSTRACWTRVPSTL